MGCQHGMLGVGALLGMGCRADVPLEFCRGATQARYDLSDDELLAFPDDALTQADPSSPTGLRVDLSASQAPWTTALSPAFQPIIDDAASRSGFARLGSVVMRFSDAVSPGPQTADDSLVDEGLMWLDLSVDPAQRVPYTTTLGEAADQLILTPLAPLRAGALHAVLMTRAHSDAAGDCIAPAPDIAARIAGEDTVVTDKVQAAIAAASVDPADLSHALVFTTQDDLGVMTAVAADIAEQEHDWLEAPQCETSDGLRSCTGRFEASDYRTGDAITDATPQDAWTLQGHIWLPVDAAPPYPTVVYGHGINGNASQGQRLAEDLAALGVAVVAVDALHHGQHPTADPDNQLPALIFLGINLSTFTFDTQSLRGSFDQSTADRLQLLALLEAEPDIDGDGTDDLDLEQVMYFGVSLGGLMGPQLMASHAPMQAGVLAVAGGNLPLFSTDTAVMDELSSLLEYLVGPPDVFDRLLPVMQMGVDAADPAVWGAHVVGDRLDGGPPADVLFPVAVIDDTVPPATAKSLARGLGLPHLAPILDPVAGLEDVSGPLHANLTDGATGAYFQLDRVSEDDAVVPANHSNVPHSPEVWWMTAHFFATHLAGETEIVEPYAVLGTPPLVESD